MPDHAFPHQPAGAHAHASRWPLRIVLDLQAAQSNSRHRGIGRHSLCVAKAIAEEAGDHEIRLALNGHDAPRILEITAQFAAWVPPERIAVGELPSGIAGCDPDAAQRRRVAALGQSALYGSLQADCIWHGSLFEGWADDSTAMLGSGALDHRHAATFYDLIPLLHPGRHLHDAGYRDWYYQRLALLKRCGLLLAVSQAAARDAVDVLHVPEERIAVIHGAADAAFRPKVIDDAQRERWRQAWRLAPDFLLYAGGYDAHKNVDALIVAYAQLPPALRRRHALVLAGRCEDDNRERLRQLARRCGLSRAEIVFTGTLSDAELAGLYAGCRLFVAPSLHEGLGLPVLEAMACGAPVIGANATSLPEVIGRADALFDPRSPSSIAVKLYQTLTDDGFLEALRAHAREHSRRFTWTASARAALAAIERCMGPDAPRRRAARPLLAYVSPLPPQRTGIADYSARLLRELASHYDIDVVTDQADVADPWVRANFRIRTPHWLMTQDAGSRRILYHFGNSPCHAWMFGLLQERPGVVMLHDSVLAAVRNWMAQQTGEPSAFLRELYASHGYAALLYDRRHGRTATLDHFPVNLDVIEHALGVMVHSRHAIALAERHYAHAAAVRMTVVPFPASRAGGERGVARRLLGFGADDFVVCSFGMLAPTKLNHRLLRAWLASPLAADPRCRLVFVGERHGGDYGWMLEDMLATLPDRSRVRITGFVEPEEYADYLAAADVAVQLRTASRGETSAAIYDALAQGLPAVINAHGAAAEITDEVALKLADEFTDDALSSALLALRDDGALRERLSLRAAAWIREVHHPARAAAAYREAIEHFSTHSAQAEDRWMAAAIERDAGEAGLDLWQARAAMRHAIAANRPRLDRPRLYVDVTATAHSKLHAGIERVVRQTLFALLDLEQTRCRIEPVRLERGRFVHARTFAQELLHMDSIGLVDDEAHPRRGDLLLGLDWAADRHADYAIALDAWKARGVRMVFGVHDLLPLRRPHWFPDDISAMHARWLACLAGHADAMLAVSRTVAEDLRRWLTEHRELRHAPLPLGYCHPGSDIVGRAGESHRAESAGTTALPDDIDDMPMFLMVGTLEPRKGHAFVLDAFERLWSANHPARLVIVGRAGWMTDALAARLRSHMQAGRRLLWLECADDACLERLYASASSLIAASEDEGFGLPLVEAARRGVPVLARDIPVFREVAGEFARFFNGGDIEALTALIETTAMDVGPPRQVTTAASVLSWHESVQRLWDMLHDHRHPQWLAPWQPVTSTSAAEHPPQS